MKEKCCGRFTTCPFVMKKYIYQSANDAFQKALSNRCWWIETIQRRRQPGQDRGCLLSIL